MRMIKLIILLLGLSGIEGRYRILKKTSDRDKKLESLAESAVLTLLSCYEKTVDTVGAIGITEPTLVDILMTKQPLPVKLFGKDNVRGPYNRVTDFRGPHKLHLFVVETSPVRQLRTNVGIAFRSQASAQLGKFLIINWPSEINQKGCSEAPKYLLEFWGFSILDAFYVCVDRLKDRVLVYTYNPHTSQAPEPWMLNKKLQGYYDHPWSLFVREYQPGNQKICNNLEFDKTHDLGGHKIRLFWNTNLPFSQLTKDYANDIYSSDSLEIVIAKYALKALNAAPDLYVIGTQGNTLVAGNFQKNITRDQFRDDAEIFLRLITSVHMEYVKTSIPFLNADFAVMTHHTGEKSQLDKLIGVFDRRTRFGICLVAIGTVLFFKFFMGQPIGTATINVIRIIGNTGLLIVPNGNAPRLYLAGVFILVVTIIGVYQGLLAAILTKPILLPDIETFEDLANSPHKIHIPDPDFAKFFTDPRFNDRLAYLVGICAVDPNAETVIHRSDACLRPRLFLTTPAIKQNLHISREPIIPAYAGYQIKENWAFEERFNEIIEAIVESGILWVLYERDIKLEIDIAEYKEKVEKDRPVVMTLSNLGFAFAFLGLGLSLATIVLVTEIAIKRRQLGQRRMRLVRRARANIKVSVSTRAIQTA